MKLSIFLFALFSGVLLFTSCNKKNDLLNNPDQLLYQSLCEASNGSLDLEIGGKKWGNSCAIAVDYGVSFYGEDTLLIGMFSYTGDGIYLNDGSFEWFYIGMYITDGPGTYYLDEDSGGACYYAGVYEWTGGSSGPSGNVTEDDSFCTDETNTSDNNTITIESINGNRIKGSFNVTGYNENNESLLMKGKFDIQLE